jgi:hypothetical protein
MCGGYEHEVYEEYCKECEGEVIHKFKLMMENGFTYKERELLGALLEDGELGCFFI